MDTQQVDTLNRNSLQYIGIPKRFLASFIDNLITLLFLYLFRLGQSEFSSPGKSIAYLALVFLLPWAYFTLLESSPEQATLGKMALGIIVVNRHGKKLSFAEANLRYFGKAMWSVIIIIAAIVYFVDPIIDDNIPPSAMVAGLMMFVASLGGSFGYLMPAFNLEKQALHDRIAKTFVIDAETRSKHLPQKALLQIVAIALVSGILFHFIPDSAVETDPSVEIEITPSPDSGSSLKPQLGGSSRDEEITSEIKTVSLCGISEPTIPASPHDYLNGVWKVQFTGQGATPHSSVLVMEGTSGIMRTEFPDVDSGTTKVVIQEMQLRSSPTRLWLLGSNPIDADTKKTVDYSPDNLYLQRQLDGQFLAYNCDILGRGSLATFEFIQEKLQN